MYTPRAPSLWKQFLHCCLIESSLLVLLSLLGCVHAAQVTESNEVVDANMRPIDLDASTAEKIGQEALRKIGYDEIIKLAEKAGFVAYKADVTIQLISYGSIVPDGFLPVFSRYAALAGVTSQADSPLPGPADVAAVGIVVGERRESVSIGAQKRSVESSSSSLTQLIKLMSATLVNMSYPSQIVSSPTSDGLQTMKKSNVDSICQAIKDAFSDTPYPGDMNIVDDVRGEGTIVVETFRGKHWKEVSPRILFLYRNSIPFFSADAYRFYLPAFMIAALSNQDILESILYSLDPKSNIDEIAFFRKAGRLNESEKKAVKLFLEFIKDEYSRDYPQEPSSALQHFWG